jgi:KRAB domain-containing zinc finger protein
MLSIHLKLETSSCDVCSYKTYSERELRTHKKSHKRPFKCQKCPKAFSTAAVLKQHQKTHEDYKRETPCEVCGALFRDEKDADQHKKRVHGKTKNQIKKVDRAFIGFLTGFHRVLNRLS